MICKVVAHTGDKKYYLEYKALFTAEEWKVRWEELLKVLANAADRQARTSKNRRDYKYIARTLKKIAAHPGGKEIAADHFWELEKRIRNDKKHPGVILEMNKSEAIWDIAILVKKKVITLKDLEGFSQELIDSVTELLNR